MSILSTSDEFRDLRAKYLAGTFDPSSVNWAVGENRVPVTDETSSEGWK